MLVGAQRPASALGSDAGMNLVNALRVAGSPEARGKGVLAVLNDEIHAARDVVKTSTYRVQTFRSLDFGALGHVDGDGRAFLPAPLRAHMPDTPFAALDLGGTAARSTSSIPTPAPMARSSTRRSPPALAGSSRPGSRREPDPGAARGVRTRGQVRGRRRAVQPRRQRPGRPAPPPAREQDRRRRGSEPAKSPHSADAGVVDDHRDRRRSKRRSRRSLRPLPARCTRVVFFLSLLIDGALAGAIYALIALAFVLVYKASRMINFAIGEWVMWGALLVATGVHTMGLGLAGGSRLRQWRHDWRWLSPSAGWFCAE